MSVPTDPGRWVIRPEDLPPEGDPLPRGPVPLRPRRDPLSLLSLVLGLLSIPLAGVALGLRAILTGILGILRARPERGDRVWPAATGLACGVAGLGIWTALVFWWLGHRRVASPPPPAAPREATAEPGTWSGAQAPEPVRRALLAHASLRVAFPGGVSTGSAVTVAASPGRVLLLTCLHVVGPSDGAQVRAAWTGAAEIPATVRWRSDPAMDLALLECRPGPGAALPAPPPVSPLGGLGVGDAVFAVGDPLNYRGSVTRGYVSALRVQEGPGPRCRLIQSQVPLNPGNSGGGLYTEGGGLVGINSWTIPKDRGEGMGFSLALEDLRSCLGRMPADLAGDVGRWLDSPGPAGAGSKRKER